jgi:hypothetical protein
MAGLTVTPAAGNELLVGFVAGHGNAETMTGGGGFTLQPQQTTGASVASVLAGSEVLGPGCSHPMNARFDVGFRLSNRASMRRPPQGFTATFTTGMYWASGIAAFKAAG